MASQPSSGPKAVEILDEAVGLIHKTPLPVLSIYYLGALPFGLGLIYFWFDMTESNSAEIHLPLEALGLTFLYFWMKTCQAVFSRQLVAVLEGEDLEPWTLQRWLQTALLQIIWAGSFFIIYPAALLITVPFGWVNAFYHSISIVATGEKTTVRSSFKEASDLARIWPKQNFFLLGIQLLAAGFLFANLAVFFIAVPQLLHMLFGLESVFEENPMAWNNSSFYVDVGVICFLLLNPLSKAIYALRCFYGRSRQNGADLKSALRRCQATPARAFALIAVLSLLNVGGLARADTPPPPPPEPAKVDPSSRQLNKAIDKTLEKDEYSWRLPRPTVEDDKQEKSWLRDLTIQIRDLFKTIFKKPAEWIAEFLKWLFHQDHKADDTSSSWKGISDIPWRAIMVLFALAVLGVLGYFLWKHVSRAKPKSLASLGAPAVRTVDLEAEDVRADELPEDSWLALAQQMMEKGELRLALRALYLATLSVLAHQQLVRLAAAKSNRDYLLELTRRTRGQGNVPDYFRENIQLFEASWYGTHAVTPTILETMRANHYQVRTHATS